MKSEVKDWIKDSIRQAKKYVEGTGVRLDAEGHDNIEDIKKLIIIKLSY